MKIVDYLIWRYFKKESPRDRSQLKTRETVLAEISDHYGLLIPKTREARAAFEYAEECFSPPAEDYECD